ncbi:MAG: universal stress protein [Deltaproteobacteria bacterium]
MALFDHLALAVDFSEPSRVALKAAFRLARMGGTPKLTVMHSVQEVVLPTGDQPVVRARLEKLKERIQSSAQKQLDAMIGEVGAPDGVTVETRIVEGAPTRIIPEVCADSGVTLLAVGTHARKGVRRWLKGSVAEAIVRGTKVPVIVMPTGDDGVTPDEELKALLNVVIAVDLHAEAAQVVRVAIAGLKSLKNRKPEVTLMTCEDLSDVPIVGADSEGQEAIDEIRAAMAEGASASLEALAAAHANSGIEIQQRVERGEPEERILAVADEVGASLIVVGTHGRHVAPFIELGSTTGKVLRSSNVSVLVIPSHPEHQA